MYEKVVFVITISTMRASSSGDRSLDESSVDMYVAVFCIASTLIR